MGLRCSQLQNSGLGMFVLARRCLEVRQLCALLPVLPLRRDWTLFFPYLCDAWVGEWVGALVGWVRGRVID